jgi:uncharacterized protein YkwD
MSSTESHAEHGGTTSHAVASGFDQVVEGILTRTNAVRANAGASPVAKEQRLMTAASRYAELMREKEELGHTVGGQTLRMRVGAVGYVWRAIGENVAWNQRPDAERVMRQWIGSPGHLANIRNPQFSDIGIGVAGPSRRGRYYYCQIFGRPRIRSAAEEFETEVQSSSMSEEIADDETAETED